MPQASRQVSSHRSFQKVHQLVGHDLNIMEDVDRCQHTCTYEPVRQSGDYPFLDDYWASSRTGSDSDGAHLHSEDGDLPLIEETDEAASSRGSSWVPSTPVAAPEPLNIWCKGSTESEDSVRSYSSSLHSSVRNFSLHTSSPKRWDPAYGQFTDHKAAGAYHRIASELAGTLPQQHTQQLQTIMDKGDCESAVATMDSPPAKSNKKSWTTGRIRLSGAAAFARLWDTSTSPETKTGPVAPVQRNTLKKPAPVRSKATALSPDVVPTAATLRAIPSSEQWPIVEQLAIKESPSKAKLHESSSKKTRKGRSCVGEPPSNQAHERNFPLQEPRLQERQPTIPFIQEPTSAKTLNEVAPKAMTQRKFLVQPHPISRPLQDFSIMLRESPMERPLQGKPEPSLREDSSKSALEWKHSLPGSASKTTLERKPSVGRGSDKKAVVAAAAAARDPSLTIDTKAAIAASTSRKSLELKKSPARQHLRPRSLSASSSRAPTPFPKKEETISCGILCSAFDSDTEEDEEDEDVEEDEDDDTGSFRWFSHSVQDDDEDEWPRVRWARRMEPPEKEARHISKTSGQMKELITNAREKALMSPAEKRREELRRSIKVLRPL